MGLDIYSGTLIRYYSHNWKTIVQQLAEENGQHCVVTDGCGNEIQPVEDAAEIEQMREIIQTWTDDFASNIEPPLNVPIWDETTEREYYTDKPDWEAYGALLLLQACQVLNHPIPEYVEKGWSVFDDPIIKEAVSKHTVNSLLAGVTLWLPVSRDSIFETELPTGDNGLISTVSLLKEELEELNRQFWKVDEATILSWRNDKYYVPINSKETKLFLGFIRRTSKTTKFRTEELAQCAYSMFYQAVRFAEASQVPIVLDY